MRHFIDRRLNPKDKSLGNRQRFLRRARAQIKKAVNESLQDRSINDVGANEKVSIPSKGIREPRFRMKPSGGKREGTYPGNKEFTPGDRIARPPGGAGSGGKNASDGALFRTDQIALLASSGERDALLEFFLPYIG